MSKNDILIVDDNPLNLELIYCLLNNQGYNVFKALNAKEARDILTNVHPDVILMDLQLPETDGFELTRQLKSNPAFEHIPIIAVTAYAMSGDKAKALAAGCDDYITKPINTRLLPGIVAKYIEQHNHAHV